MTPEEQIRVLAEGLATIYSGATTDEGSALRDWLDEQGVRLQRTEPITERGRDLRQRLIHVADVLDMTEDVAIGRAIERYILHWERRWEYAGEPIPIADWIAQQKAGR